MAEKKPELEPQVEVLSSQPEAYDDADNAEVPPSGTAMPPQAQEETGEWKKKHDELKEKLMWVAADFDNYKKRALKEKEEFLKFSSASVLKEFLVVVDNLERAAGSIPTDDQDKGLLALKQGVDLTLKQFQSVLEKHGVSKIKAVGSKFNPRFHEVMFQEETDRFPDETVMEELQSGYLLHERVLRPALVKVAKNQHPAVGGQPPANG